MLKLWSVWVNLFRSSLYVSTSLQRAYFAPINSFFWHKKFKKRREKVEDDFRCGKPSTSRDETNAELVKKMVRGDRRLTVRLISNELKLN